MANNLRDLRRKMKSIKSTKQVTKAMELVAASKMRRAVQNAQTLRGYAALAWQVLEKIGLSAVGLHPFLKEQPPQKILVILFTSDRGLCGSLNAHLFKATQQYINEAKKVPSFQSIDFIAVGRKGQQFLTRSQQNVVAVFPALANNPAFRDTLPIARFAMEEYTKGTYDHIAIIHSLFLSALNQEPTDQVLLPLSESELRRMATGHTHRKISQEEPSEPIEEYLFEPSPSAVLDVILPQLTEIQLFQAVLESAASEHSARMVAMRNASDNAQSFLDDLTLTYNQTRQSIITSELAELSGAVAAMGG
jgi:F-type H+-transporting ATPase subunit gamma